MLKNKIRLTHLILSGGGTHGSVQVGALRFLMVEGLHTSITHISCCSIGCYVAMMYCLKFSIDEMEEVIKKFVSSPKCIYISISSLMNIFTQLGLTETKHIFIPLLALAKEKYPHDDIENFTFVDIAKKFGINLYVSVTDICGGQNKIFSIDDTPDVNVFMACRASMSLPFVYTPVKINDRYYVDGALTNNFPITVFRQVPDENKLGLAINNVSDNDDPGPSATMNIFIIIQNIMNMILQMVRDMTFLQYIKKKYVIIFDKIPANWFGYELKRDHLHILKITFEELDKMFVYGFNITARYMIKKEKEFVDDI